MIRPSSPASPRRARFPSRTLLFFSSLYLLSLSRTHSRNTCSVHAHHPRRCLFLHAPFLSSSAVVHKLNHNPKFQTFLSRLTAPTPERDPVSPSARRVPRPDFTVTHRPTFHFPLYFFFPSPLTACPFNTSSSGVVQLQDHTARVHDPSTH